MSDFSKRLKDLRKKIGVSQTDISKATNIAQTTYSNYESKNCEPSISNLIKLADFFNITIDELVERPTDMLNLSLLDDRRKELIKYLASSSNSTFDRIDAFYQGVKLAEEEREEIIKRMKGQK